MPIMRMTIRKRKRGTKAAFLKSICLNRLCGNISTWEILARPKGFEPLTPRFVVWCSIQLSYGRALEVAK